jgi:predicted transcriptional regulator
MGKERKPGRSRSQEPPHHETLRLSASGAGMLLGDLEHLLMETAWKLGRPASARQLHAKVFKSRAIELITVVTVLNRLVSPKQLMRREKIDDLFHYAPILSREEFMQRASRRVVERVLALGHEAVTASMVDVLAEKDPDLLAELGRRVRQRLREDAKNK